MGRVGIGVKEAEYQLVKTENYFISFSACLIICSTGVSGASVSSCDTTFADGAGENPRAVSAATA